MKKFIAILLVVATMLLCLTACVGKKATAVITFDNVESVTTLPVQGVKNISVGVEFNVMTVNVANEGVYTMPILADGTSYNFTLTYENGKFTGEADGDLTFSIQ